MEDYQNNLFPYAYNILGSVEDAKDAVQDVLVKFHSLQDSYVENTVGYLIRSVVNQAINLKKRKSKLYQDTIWLPEPLSTENPDNALNKAEILSYSMLVLLEKLSPKERAVFILKNAFDYSHKEISVVIDSTIEGSRKLLSRANLKVVTSKKKRNQRTLDINKSYMEHYMHVIRTGDVENLEKMLSDDISLAADGGGKISVVRELTFGKSATLELLFYVFQTYQELQTVTIGEVNHQPALFFYQDDKLVNCQVFELENNKIHYIFSILAPSKLKFIV